MKKTFLNLSVLLILFVSGSVAVSTANAQTTTRTGNLRTNFAERDRHPMIRKAIAALDSVKGDLQNAAHDYCGHRVEALEAVNVALSQLRRALASDTAQIVAPKESPSKAMFVSASFDKSDLEQHPKIKQAIQALENARNDLQNSARDFKGHRSEALEAVNNALNQLAAAIACDKN